MVLVQEQCASEDNSGLSRRQFVGVLAALGGLSLIPGQLLAAIPKANYGVAARPVRSLAFENLHTGENTKLVYWERGNYIRGALSEIDHILRDHRTNEVKRIDKALLDRLFVLHNTLGSQVPFQVISGYRSPKSNAMMHAHSSGVAKKSMHMEGKAIDIRLPDVGLLHVRNAALAMNSGGVGYYPDSKFVHIDTGRVRHW